MSEKVKVTCNRDQKWSFGKLKKGQVVAVSKDIAATMVESGYGEYFDSEKKRIISPAEENKSLDPAEENKSEVEEPVDFTKMTKKDDLEAYALEKFEVDINKSKSVKNIILEIQDLEDGVQKT